MQAAFTFPSATAPITTDQGFTVVVESATVALPGATVSTAATSGEGSSTFDPANPPPGCTLCHGGHCHCGDRLVPYEELAGGGGTAGESARYEGPVTVDARTAELARFPTRTVPEKAWTTLTLDAPVLTVTGRVDGPGLSGERFVMVVEDMVSTALTQSGDLELSTDREPLVLATMRVTLPDGLFNGIAFQNLEVRNGARRLDRNFAPTDVAKIRERVADESSSALEVRRSEDLSLLPKPDPAFPRRQEFGFQEPP
ncbi:MAG: hypothetical protein AB2A00_08900 [Myxococcota bacterium]